MSLCEGFPGASIAGSLRAVTSSQVCSFIGIGFLSGFSLWAIGYAVGVLRRAADMVDPG